jgi:type III pantothenate kinase
MSAMSGAGLLAIDVGTSRVKLGWLPGSANCPSTKPVSELPITAPQLPEPAEMFACCHRDVSRIEFAGQLSAWLAQFVDDKPNAVLASVNSTATTTVVEILTACGFLAPQILQVSHLPIRVELREPGRVGIDRVLAAVAVNRLRSPEKPAIVISLGTAATVNFISMDGTFQGGAILPGLGMSARALHTGTSTLPLIGPESLMLPENALGKDTNEALSAGIFWGLVGSIEKLIQQQCRALSAKPQLFLTGGDAPLVVDALEASGHTVRLVPHLVLSGIAIACEAP